MAEQPDFDNANWTLSTLHLHLTQRISAAEVASRDRLAAVEARIVLRWALHDATEVEADRRYTERFEAQQKALATAEITHATAMQNAKEAVLKAEAATEHRFHAVNAFRDTLSDQAVRLMPRVEVDNRLHAMSDKIADMGARLDRADGKGIGIAAIWGVIVGAAGLLGIIATIALNVLRPH